MTPSGPHKRLPVSRCRPCIPNRQEAQRFRARTKKCPKVNTKKSSDAAAHAGPSDPPITGSRARTSYQRAMRCRHVSVRLTSRMIASDLGSICRWQTRSQQWIKRLWCRALFSTKDEPSPARGRSFRMGALKQAIDLEMQAAILAAELLALAKTKQSPQTKK
jgi:hypothetical protein